MNIFISSRKNQLQKEYIQHGETVKAKNLFVDKVQMIFIAESSIGLIKYLHRNMRRSDISTIGSLAAIRFNKPAEK